MGLYKVKESIDILQPVVVYTVKVNKSWTTRIIKSFVKRDPEGYNYYKFDFTDKKIKEPNNV